MAGATVGHWGAVARRRGGAPPRVGALPPGAGARSPVEAGQTKTSVDSPSSAGVAVRSDGAAQLMEDFPRVFDGHIRTMPGEEFDIRLREDARPFCVTTPRRVPLSLCDQLRAELDRLESEQIIRRVTEPTEWCADAPIVVAPKKGGAGIRL